MHKPSEPTIRKIQLKGIFKRTKGYSFNPFILARNRNTVDGLTIGSNILRRIEIYRFFLLQIHICECRWSWSEKFSLNKYIIIQMADIRVRFSVIFRSQNEKINSKMTTPDTTADSGKKQSETGSSDVSKNSRVTALMWQSLAVLHSLEIKLQTEKLGRRLLKGGCIQVRTQFNAETPCNMYKLFAAQ